MAALAAREELALRAGVEVRLEVRPVDPMSLFAGRYVSVPLAIQRLDRTVPIQGGIEPGHAVYVRLERGEPFWTAVAATREPPAEGAVFLCGKWKEANQVDYGIDTFYIREDGADPSQLKLALVLRVTRDGRAVIEDLLVQGRPYAEWNAAQRAR